MDATCVDKKLPFARLHNALLHLFREHIADTFDLVDSRNGHHNHLVGRYWTLRTLSIPAYSVATWNSEAPQDSCALPQRLFALLNPRTQALFSRTKLVEPAFLRRYRY